MTESRPRPRLSLPLAALAAALGLLAAPALAGDRFEVAGGGATFVDTRTGLEWSRCRYGDSWDGDDDCEINYGGNRHFHDDVLGNDLEYGPHDDWRVPSLEQMKTLLFCDAADGETAFKETDRSKREDALAAHGYVVGYDRADCATRHQNALGEMIPSLTRTATMATATLDEEVEHPTRGAIRTAWFVNINDGHYSREILRPRIAYSFFLVRER